MHTHGTDEKLDKAVKRGPDLDTVMLFGCSGFMIVALAVWAMVVWPFFVFQDTYSLASLRLCLLIGLIPASLIGAFATRAFGLSTAAGFLGGLICSATFLYLRLQQVVAFRGIPEAPQPEFPDLWVWLIPLGWFLFGLLLIALFLKPSEYRIGGSDKST